MIRNRISIFLILFTLFSVVGIYTAMLTKERQQNLIKEEVEGLKDISRVPKVINLPPINVLVADEYSYTPHIVDSDTPIEEISIILKSGPSWISVSGHQFKGIPSALDIGTHEVVYILSDGENQITQSFHIVVTIDEQNS